MQIISIYNDFATKGGAQDIAIILAKKLNDRIPAVLTKTPDEKIHDVYKKENVGFEYLTIKNILKYNTKDSIYISHSRKTTTFLMLLNNILQNKLFIIHVAHNTFTNLRYFTILPQNIIAVSSAVKDNLIDYFRINEKRIKVIYNGIEDVWIKDHEMYNLIDSSRIKILFAGRITKVKQQVELVINTKGSLNSNVEIYFAGEGDMQKLLKEAIGQSNQYKILGYIDIKKEIKNYDYVYLFSQKEGLALSLIEGCMFGKPLLTNDIEAVLEINEHNYNGFVAGNWKELIMCMNKLPNRFSDEYNRLSLNARKKYESCFTIDKMLSEYRDYVDICKKFITDGISS